MSRRQKNTWAFQDLDSSPWSLKVSERMFLGVLKNIQHPTKLLTSAKFLICYCFSVIVLLRIKK